jgi:hypothetical protein
MANWMDAYSMIGNNKLKSGFEDSDTLKPLTMQQKSFVPYAGGDNMAEGAMSGAATGSAFGPQGAIIGAALGGISGASKKKDEEFKAKQAGMSNALGTYLWLIDKGMV